MTYSLFISCPKNMEYLLEDELVSLGLNVDKVSPRGVYGQATLEVLYQIGLWSRLANRVHLILFKADVSDLASFRRSCVEFTWDKVFSVDRSFAVEFHGRTEYINNTMFGGQLIKDGIVDFFNQHYQKRPNVCRESPNVRIQGYLKRNELTVSLDLVGRSLHQRGYRLTHAGAPLKENTAAGLLIRAGWPKIAAAGGPLVDPFCGSATVLIEAALMVTNTAPGLLRSDQNVRYWLGHDSACWKRLREKAQQQQVDLESALLGFDVDPRSIAIAKENIERAGLSAEIKVKQQAIQHFKALPSKPGLLACNPPYGERLKDPLSLIPTYQALGQAAFNYCPGWRCAVLTSNPLLAQAMGLRIDKRYQFFNGALAVTLHCFDVALDNKLSHNTRGQRHGDALALFNRVVKIHKHLGKWLKRTGVSCYRLYDADLPTYAFAVDVYEDWLHVQEYAPPKEIPVAKTQKRLIELLDVLEEVLKIDRKKIVLKERQRQRGRHQYQVVDRQRERIKVREGDAAFYVNLRDYLDTGLFLDHRPLRQKIGRSCQGKRFLNLFCYTAAFSVHAALGGAKTTNVDLSNTYLNWAKDNFSLNKLPVRHHHFVQADCLKWLKGCQQRFDVILLDPPSFSNSKRMDSTFDVQRDHVDLIQQAMALLAPQGVLYFSNNLSHFSIESSLLERYEVDDLTASTLDEDFKKRRRPHCCFRIRARECAAFESE